MHDYVHNLFEYYTLSGDETEQNKVLKLWDGLKWEIWQTLSEHLYHPEVNTWVEIVAKAEAIEIGHQQREQEQCSTQNESNRDHQGHQYNDYVHNRRADNCRTNDNLEWNKYNAIPQSQCDYSPKPACKTANEGAREFFGDKTVPARKWEKPCNLGRIPAKPKMSQEECDWHFAEGLCLNCHEPGHKACECPKLQNVSGAGNRPPGKSSPGRMGNSHGSTTTSANITLKSS